MGDNKVYSKPYINQLDVKATPVAADVMLLEDSADSWGKKKVLVSALASAAGLGDVDGPSASTDNAIVRFDGTGGKTIQDYTQSAPTVDDDGNMTINATLGANIITNGTFNTDLTGWTGANWSWSSGKALHTAGATTKFAQAAAAVVAGSTYKVVYTISGRTAGSLIFAVGGVDSMARSTNATFTKYYTAITTASAEFYPTTDFDGAIDDVSLQLVTNGSLSVENDLIMKGGQLRFNITPTIENIARTLTFYNLLDGATGNEAAFKFNYTTNKVVSGDDTGIVINQTDTASPGTSLLLDLQTGGVSQFYVNNTGSVLMCGGVYATLYSDVSGGLVYPVKLSPGTNTSLSGSIIATEIVPTYNQASGTAANTDLLIYRTETALGSGAQRFLSMGTVALGVLTYFRNDGVYFPRQVATASAPTYTLGGIYFDTTLNKLRVGGAAGWETITSA